MEQSKIISELNPKSPAAEAYRILRTNLQFSTVDKPLQTLLVSSAGPSEGKSYTVANLGAVMAQAGARVIVVDCDLRRAKQHTLFNKPNTVGLTNVLVGQAELRQVVQDTGVPNLSLLTSGPLPPNPAELLGSAKTKDVFSQLTELADLVLLDSPPVLVVADATILSALVDGVVLVIRAARTKTDAMKQAKERLVNANARIVGTIMNAVEGSGGYYYYYGSGYYGESGRQAAAAKQ